MLIIIKTTAVIYRATKYARYYSGPIILSLVAMTNMVLSIIMSIPQERKLRLRKGMYLA